MTAVSGVMQMRKRPNGLEPKPGTTTELKPGGSYHLMLIDLTRPLRPGETLKGTLTFEKAGTVPVEFEVERMGTRSSGHSAQP